MSCWTLAWPLATLGTQRSGGSGQRAFREAEAVDDGSENGVQIVVIGLVIAVFRLIRLEAPMSIRKSGGYLGAGFARNRNK